MIDIVKNYDGEIKSGNRAIGSYQLGMLFFVDISVKPSKYIQTISAYHTKDWKENNMGGRIWYYSKIVTFTISKKPISIVNKWLPDWKNQVITAADLTIIKKFKTTPNIKDIPILGGQVTLTISCLKLNKKANFSINYSPRQESPYNINLWTLNKISNIN